MSVQVANIDFSSAVVGQTGRIVNLSQLLPPPTIAQQMRPQDNTQVAHLSMFNESGALLTILLPDTLQTKTLPAGRWLILPIPPNETEVDYQIVALAAGAPFHNLLVDYFYPGEAVEALGVVGNSPVGVSGNVSTSGAGGTSFIKNDGAAPATSIAESTPSDQVSSSVSLNNDASGFLQVLSANVLRKILNVVRGNATTGKAVVTLGDSNDATITTFYGSLQGAQPASVGAITTAASYGWIPTGVGSGFLAALDINPAGATVNKHWGIYFNGGDGHIQIQNVTDNVDAVDVDPSGNVTMSGVLNVNGASANFVPYTKSAGGGAAGRVNWQGTVDPGVSAAEGDTWDKG